MRRMAKRLWESVQAIARRREISDLRLQELMAERGFKYGPMYMDSFAYPDDIRILAEILQVPSSVLFEATSYLDELVDAVFEEEWLKYKGRVGITKQEAYKRVIESEYRWIPSQSTVRSQIKLVLEALEPPSGRIYGCEYPDCDNCTTRCEATGRLKGAEG